AVSNYRYIGSLPQELCLIMPMILHPYCKLPLDNLQNLATFMILGLTFCGIYNSSTTFAVADIPRLIAASFMFSISFIMFYSNETKFCDHYLIILLSYFAAWSSGSNPTLTEVESNS
ncbi:24146_t:CDS:2, partial [Entrophospora sp. SA101]